MNFKKMTFLCMQKLTNFPYIEDDFDALTNYELLCKVVEYLNKVIANENAQNEALNELATAFNNLKDYVDNYFDNLDVQDEINNKLDEMAESGQLTDIIAQYLGLAGMIAFDTVADMKLAENLVNGSKCRTLGFYSVNDGGGAYYKIRTVTNDDVIDESSIIAVYDNLLVAELVIEEEMMPEQFGAKGDGEIDDCEKIDICLQKSNSVIMNKNYLVNITATSKLNPKSNQIIEINGNIIMNTSNLDGYRIFDINNKSNILIKGIGKIIGDRETHTGSSGEWGMGISIVDSNNIKIKDLTIVNCWGDGIYIGRNTSHSTNILIDGVLCDNNRRQGISVVDGDYITIVNSSLNNTSGTAPQTGIDIEPNTSADFIGNITIDNCNLFGNASNYSLTYILNNGQGGSNIKISNLKCDGAIGGTTKLNDKINVNDAVISFTTPHSGILLYSDETSIVNYTNITCISSLSSPSGVTGIINAFLTSTLPCKIYNASINNLIAIGEFPRFYTGAQVTSSESNGINISGNLEKATFVTPVSNGQLFGNLIKQRLTSDKLTADGLIQIDNLSYLNCSGNGDQRVVCTPALMVEGQEVEVVKTGTGNLVISFNNVPYYYNGTTGTTLTLANPCYINCKIYRDHILIK